MENKPVSKMEYEEFMKNCSDILKRSLLGLVKEDVYETYLMMTAWEVVSILPLERQNEILLEIMDEYHKQKKKKRIKIVYTIFENANKNNALIKNKEYDKMVKKFSKRLIKYIRKSIQDQPKTK